MKRNNKKGFTIVELVIVIAVIAILAAVLIPTFSNVIEKANTSAALQESKNCYTEWMADALGDGKIEDSELSNTPAGYNGTMTVTLDTNKTNVATFKYVTTKYTCEYKTDAGVWTVTKTPATPAS